MNPPDRSNDETLDQVVHGAVDEVAAKTEEVIEAVAPAGGSGGSGGLGGLLADELSRLGEVLDFGLLIRVVVVAGLALGLAWVGRRLIRIAWRLGFDRDRNLTRLAILIEAAVVVFALAVGLRPVSVELPVLTAGVAVVTGLVVALAMPKRVENVVAGLSVALFARHRVGDQIEAGGIRGSVRDLGLARTRLRVEDGTEYWLPNAMLEANAVKVSRSTGAALVQVRFEVSPKSHEKVLEEVRMVASLSPYRRAGSRPHLKAVSEDETVYMLELQTWATRDVDIVRRSLAAAVERICNGETADASGGRS